MRAYLLNNYYLFTDYNDLSSHIYDVVHFAKPRPPNATCGHAFSVMMGEVRWDQMVFINDEGERIPIKYEKEYDFYFSEKEDQREIGRSYMWESI